MFDETTLEQLSITARPRSASFHPSSDLSHHRHLRSPLLHANPSPAFLPLPRFLLVSGRSFAQALAAPYRVFGTLPRVYAAAFRIRCPRRLSFLLSLSVLSATTPEAGETQRFPTSQEPGKKLLKYRGTPRRVPLLILNARSQRGTRNILREGISNL